MTRTTGACAECNKRKVKCYYAGGRDQRRSCDACAASGVDCVSRVRKKRKSAQENKNAQPQPSQHVKKSPLCENSYKEISHQDWRLEGVPYGSTCSASAERPGQSSLENTSGLGTQTSMRMPTSSSRLYNVAGTLLIDGASSSGRFVPESQNLPDPEFKTLKIWDCHLIPPKAVRQSLVDIFMERCYPWTPVLCADDIDNERPGSQVSLLLQQTLFLAASRVSAAPGVATFASSEQFYQRAKVLFWLCQENNPLAMISATIMLQWYNPAGPEHISFNVSRFWLQIGVGLAHQVGVHKQPTSGPEYLLRRRLWWSLVARDSLISSGQGRPRVINLRDSDVRPPCLEDFPNSLDQGELFMSYVEICVLLGDLTQCRSRRQMSRGKKLQIENTLYRWIKSLPSRLRISKSLNNMDPFRANANNFNARQLRLPYLVTLIIMSRPMACHTPRAEICYPSTLKPVSPAAVIASSFVAGIYEEFLARDELQYLGPIFTFYLLASGITLVTTCRDSNLWQVAQQDLEVIQNSLKELSKRWKSAIGALQGLRKVIERAELELTTNNNLFGQNEKLMLQLSTEEQILLDDLPRDLCCLWPYVSCSEKSNQQNPTISYDLPDNHSRELDSVGKQPQELITNQETTETLEDFSYPASQSAVLHIARAADCNSLSAPMPVLDEPVNGDASVAEAENREDFGAMADYDCQYVGIGDWLVNDWGSEMTW